MKMLKGDREKVGLQTGAVTEVWRIVKKSKLKLPYDPAIPDRDMYLKDSTSYSKDTCPVMFIAAILATTRFGGILFSGV